MISGEEATTFGGSAEIPMACSSSPPSSIFHHHQGGVAATLAW